MWQRGNFGSQLANHSALPDNWSQTGLANTPFDQSFYLILNVAVGATNGFFPDGVSNKPWGDASLTAPKQFYDARGLWEPTWGAGDARGCLRGWGGPRRQRAGYWTERVKEVEDWMEVLTES